MASVGCTGSKFHRVAKGTVLLEFDDPTTSLRTSSPATEGITAADAPAAVPATSAAHPPAAVAATSALTPEATAAGAVAAGETTVQSRLDLSHIRATAHFPPALLNEVPGVVGGGTVPRIVAHFGCSLTYLDLSFQLLDDACVASIAVHLPPARHPPPVRVLRLPHRPGRHRRLLRPHPRAHGTRG